ncbi:hypothetical protein [Sphingomonas sp.]|uniref:hypothetical protein n=1 Tax=Sphingomonas sp. TaxID=28214 RepID=UPI003D6C9AF9
MFSRLFRSRWAALFWACGILWTAVDVAGYAPAAKPASADNATEDALGVAVNNGDLAILANAMGTGG